ncbi:Brix domain-containing protein [Xylogone sp. PMI_703]|nr:Brix domain-containing protein [Xylogone sp. PMI_703]
MLRQIKPRNARSKRALDKKAPKVVEGGKTALFLRGTTCSQVVQDALTDLSSLKAPLCKRFTKKNDIHPFVDASSLEFFSERNDCSLLFFGASSKKRGHAITMARTFGYKVLDMLELSLDPESFRTMAQFRNKNKVPFGLKPLLCFAGTVWDNPTATEYTLAKSIFTDFFKGEPADKVDVEGLQYMICISAKDEVEGEPKPVIHLRAYLIKTKRSGQRLPRVEVEEMGPRMDFRVGRMKEPEEAMLKEAMKRAKTTQEKPKKNISTDIIGDKIGRIHLGKQNMSELQTRKMKGLKRSRDVPDDEDDEMDEDVISEDEPAKKPKKKRT